MSELQNYILELSIPERIKLITFISSSIDQELGQKFEIPETWVQEAQERLLRIQEGKSKTLSWEEVKAKVYGGK
ncbi:MAG: addiction module protein [Bacteroidota bacterium]